MSHRAAYHIHRYMLSLSSLWLVHDDKEYSDWKWKCNIISYSEWYIFNNFLLKRLLFCTIYFFYTIWYDTPQKKKKKRKFASYQVFIIDKLAANFELSYHIWYHMVALLTYCHTVHVAWRDDMTTDGFFGTPFFFNLNDKTFGVFCVTKKCITS